MFWKKFIQLLFLSTILFLSGCAKKRYIKPTQGEPSASMVISKALGSQGFPQNPTVRYTPFGENCFKLAGIPEVNKYPERAPMLIAAEQEIAIEFSGSYSHINPWSCRLLLSFTPIKDAKYKSIFNLMSAGCTVEILRLDDVSKSWIPVKGIRERHRTSPSGIFDDGWCESDRTDK
jgi:hypothetical protein